MADSRLFGAVILSVFLLLSGCAGSSSQLGEEGLGTIIDLDRAGYPLTAFDLSEAELDTVLRARYLLTQQCADSFGEKLPAWQSGRHRPSLNDRYGMYDEQTARGWAYSLDGPAPTVPLWEDQIDRNSALFQIVNGTDAAARPGLPQGGCRGAADRRLGWDKIGSGNPLPELESKAWHASRQDQAVKDAAAAWTRCMTRRGHTYSDPVLAPYSYWTSQRMAAHPNPTKEERTNGIPPTDAERHAALDDIRCKNESGFVRAWLDADLAAQRQLVAEHRARLDGHRRALEQVLRNAADVR